MPKVTKGSVTVDLSLKDMLAYLEEDLQTDCSYVQDRFNQIFGIDLPFDGTEFDLFLQKDVIRIYFPEEENA